MTPSPLWFRTLLVTDLCERFGFYGLQAILVLYGSAAPASGGLGLDVADATALFGAWIGFTFLLSLPGGWVADRILGARRAVVTGAVVLLAGYGCLAAPIAWLSAPGLVLVSVGTGLYKPNHQAMINLLFPDARRREASISLVYSAIQASALAAPLVVGFVGERVNWHAGFACAAVAPAVCLAALAVAANRRGPLGESPGRPLDAAGRAAAGRRAAVAVAVLAVLLAAGVGTGVLSVRLTIVVVGLCCLVLPLVMFVRLHGDRGLASHDRRRLRSFLWVFCGTAVFWMVIAQAGSVLTVFARDATDRSLGGLTIPAGWLQSATPAFMLVLAPLFAWRLRRATGGLAGLPVKFAAGLLLAGGSFLVMAVAATQASGGERVSPVWLLLTYLVQAIGELVVAAAGIAATADVLPRRYLSHALGLWWLFASLGGGLGSQLVRLTGVLGESRYFLLVGSAVALTGLVLLARKHSVVRGLTAPAPALSSTRVPPLRQH